MPVRRSTSSSRKVASTSSRARALLATLEGGEKLSSPSAPRKGKGRPDDQLDLFVARPAVERAREEVLATLRELDVDRLTGIEALTLLARLKQKL